MKHCYIPFFMLLISNALLVLAGDTPCTVETSQPSVFAAGDYRSGSPKRVAFAIGDGATAVTSVHKFLEGTRPERRGGESM